MAADTFSSILGWLQMGTGNDNNTWGTNWNNNVGAILEKAIAGTATHDVAGFSANVLDLSTNPPPAGPTGAIEMMHVITGVFGALSTIKIPNLAKVYIFINLSTGSTAML